MGTENVTHHPNVYCGELVLPNSLPVLNAELSEPGKIAVPTKAARDQGVVVDL
jgi:hypothetical protein